MCLATAYKVDTGLEEPEKLLEYVSRVNTEEGLVRLTDIMGKELEVKGSVKYLDLESSKIYIQA